MDGGKLTPEWLAAQGACGLVGLAGLRAICRLCSELEDGGGASVGGAAGVLGHIAAAPWFVPGCFVAMGVPLALKLAGTIRRRYRVSTYYFGGVPHGVENPGGENPVEPDGMA